MDFDTERSFTRETILERLRARVAEGKAIVGAGCSAGIIARSAEAGGADIIIVYNTGRSRIMGLPTSHIGQANPTTLSMYDEIDNVVQHTPIVGGAHAADLTYSRLNRLLDAFVEKGYDGIINFPSAGNNLTFANRREHVGQGMQREIKMIKLAHERGIFTMGYAYTAEQATLLAAAGVDVLVPHAGWTMGGDFGADSSTARDEAATLAHVQQLLELGRAENPDIIVLAHGGSFGTPEDTRRLYEATDAQGFVGASSIERIPVERAVREAVAGFRDFRLRDAAQNGSVA